MTSGPEQQLHRAVAQYLDAVLMPPAWWTTFPAGGGGLVRGKILHGLGLKPGVPDILIISRGNVLWIELKAAGKYASPVQRLCHFELAMAGSPVGVVRSLEELEAFLIAMSVPLRSRLAA